MITGLAREIKSLMLWHAAQLALWLLERAQERSSAGNSIFRRSKGGTSQIASST
jgi:hypothetical protein